MVCPRPASQPVARTRLTSTPRCTQEHHSPLKRRRAGTARRSRLVINRTRERPNASNRAMQRRANEALEPAKAGGHCPPYDSAGRPARSCPIRGPSATRRALPAALASTSIAQSTSRPRWLASGATATHARPLSWSWRAVPALHSGCLRCNMWNGPIQANAWERCRAWQPASPASYFVCKVVIDFWASACALSSVVACKPCLASAKADLSLASVATSTLASTMAPCPSSLHGLPALASKPLPSTSTRQFTTCCKCMCAVFRSAAPRAMLACARGGGLLRRCTVGISRLHNHG